MPLKSISRQALGGLLILSSLPASAVDFKTNGFLTVGVEISDVKDKVADSTNTYVRPTYDPSTSNGVTTKPNFNYNTLLGMQLEAKLDDKLSFVTQLLAPGYDNYRVQASWLFARYNFNDHIVGRAGRLRAPFLMMSEYLQVGYAYSWLNPPRGVYNQIPISFANFTGADISYNTQLMKQDVSLTAFAGGAANQYPDIIKTTSFGAQTNINLIARNLMGVTATIGDETFKVRANYSSAKVSASPNLNVLQQLQGALRTAGNSHAANILNIDNKWFNFIGAGYKLEWKNIYSVAEYTRMRYSGVLNDSYAWYATLGYRFQEKFLPTVTYSRYATTGSTDINRIPKLTGPFAAADALRSGIYNSLTKAEDNFIVSLRYDVRSNLALKASWTQAKPKHKTTGLFDLVPKKSKANLFGLGLNLVF